jgi:uncharacterized protein YjbI with pentapeptide repeats
MKIIKPQKLSIQFKVCEEEGRYYFFPAIFMLFPFINPSTILSEVAMWKLVGEKLGKGAILDMGMPKMRGEVLVNGACYTPDRVPQRACPVTLRIGAVNKTLIVTGNRFWTALGGISPPDLFTVMPLTWQNSFGGMGYELNPVGKGYCPVIGEDGEAVHPLPNIQYSKEMVGAVSDRPLPACFAPIDITWPQRSHKSGTYDTAWLDRRFPGFAADMNPTFFNTAPEDQWLKGYFVGDEAFSLEHMHPERALLTGRLPELTARCFIRRATSEPGSLEEITMRLDTVYFFPDVEQGILIYRGGAEIATDDAEDLSLFVAAAERMGAPKGCEHYREVVNRRLDKEMGAVHSLRDQDLLPHFDAVTDMQDDGAERAPLPTGREDLLRKNMRRGAEKKLAEVREQIANLGVNPDNFLPASLPPEPAPVDMEKLDVKLLELEELKKKAQENAVLKQAHAERQLRDLCTRQGIEFDQLLAGAKSSQGGQPKFSAFHQLKQMKELQARLKLLGISNQELDRQLADPSFERKLRLAEEKTADTYRRNVHHFPPSPLPAPEDAKRLREIVLSGHAAGDSFCGADLTGADLSGLSLVGADFRAAILEGINLSGSDLSGADFTNAVLASANLTDAKCTETKFCGANIGRAVLKNADMSGGLDMRDVVLAKSDLSGAKFNGADMTGADLSECLLHKTDLSGIKAPRLIFISSDLRGIRGVEADLSRGIFIRTDVGGADFSSAKLARAVFVTARGEGVSFRAADLENLRIVKDSDFTGADFQGAVLKRVNFRGTKLEDCSFAKADLSHADLSQCNIRSGSLQQVSAKGTRFEKTDLSKANLASIDLMQGSLRKACFHGADFRGANLYGVDFEKTKGDRCTDFRHANLKKTRMIAWVPK